MVKKLNKLMVRLMGGKGSGNFGHAGRPGKVGGSGPIGLTSSSTILPSNPTSLEYSNYKLLQDKVNLNNLSKPVYIRFDDLPEPKSGMTRIFHGTSSSNLESIDEKGLLSGKEIGSKERLSNILGVKDEASEFGEISIVLDMPEGTYREINKSWVEMPEVKKENIVGYYISKMSTDDVSKLMSYYQEYNEKYQKSSG